MMLFFFSIFSGSKGKGCGKTHFLDMRPVCILFCFPALKEMGNVDFQYMANPLFYQILL